MSQCINLMPSENMTSEAVRALLSSDMGHRYTLPLNTEIHGSLVENAYRGTRLMDEVEEVAEGLAREVFGATYANLHPLSGHVAGMAMLTTLTNAGDAIAVISSKNGGYDGYMPGYLPDILGLEVSTLPFSEETFTLRTEAACEAIKKSKPTLVVLGASFILFPYDLKAIRESCDEVGCYLGYDGSHVLGLIAGGRFQPDCTRFVDILVGSTHKSFFGPQGGIVLSRDHEIGRSVDGGLTWKILDNAHWNRIAALGQALHEARRWGQDYAEQTCKNARAFGKALIEEGIPVRYEDMGITQSHQVLLSEKDMEKKYGRSTNDSAKLLENSNIIIDCVGRLGTNEVTRLGLKEKDMAVVAGLLSRALSGEPVGDEASTFRSQFAVEYV